MVAVLSKLFFFCCALVYTSVVLYFQVGSLNRAIMKSRIR